MAAGDCQIMSTSYHILLFADAYRRFSSERPLLPAAHFLLSMPLPLSSASGKLFQCDVAGKSAFAEMTFSDYAERRAIDHISMNFFDELFD